MIAVIGNRSGITNKVLGTFNLVAIPVVIPARAGIQWLMKDMPAQRV